MLSVSCCRQTDSTIEAIQVAANETGLRVDQLLASHFLAISRSRIQRACKQGLVEVNGQMQEASGAELAIFFCLYASYVGHTIIFLKKTAQIFVLFVFPPLYYYYYFLLVLENDLLYKIWTGLGRQAVRAQHMAQCPC